MTTIQAMAGGRVGFVRAVFSKRVRGHAVPVDLLRVNLRVANRAGVRRRVAAAFSGYLVTDIEPIFSDRRSKHIRGMDEFAVTGGPRQSHVVLEGTGGGPLDAPYFMPSGAMRVYASDSGGVVVSGRAYRWGCGT